MFPVDWEEISAKSWQHWQDPKTVGYSRSVDLMPYF